MLKCQEHQKKTRYVDSKKRCIAKNTALVIGIAERVSFSKQNIHQIYADLSIFLSNDVVRGSFITTFVDKLNIFASYTNKIISRIKRELVAAFNIVDMRPLVFYV